MTTARSLGIEGNYALSCIDDILSQRLWLQDFHQRPKAQRVLASHFFHIKSHRDSDPSVSVRWVRVRDPSEPSRETHSREDIGMCTHRSLVMRKMCLEAHCRLLPVLSEVEPFGTNARLVG